MSKYYVNILTEYKSPEISNKYIELTLKKSNEPHIDFVIVDNSEDEDNFEKLSSFYSTEHDIMEYKGRQIRSVNTEINGLTTRILYIKNTKNTGYGAGCNLAMFAACEILDPDYIIISNNDMVCTDEYIDLKKADSIFSVQSDIGLIGVSVQNLDGSCQSPCREVCFTDRWILPELFYPFSRKFKKRTAGDIIKNAPSDKVYRVRGSFMIILPKAFQECGGFDENVFMYAEEPILSERLKKCGYSVYHLSEIHMLHNHVMDGKTLTNSEIKKLKQRFNSELYYYKKYKGVSDAKIRIAKILFPFYSFRYNLYMRMKQKNKSK